MLENIKDNKVANSKWYKFIPPALVLAVFLITLLIYSTKAQLMLIDTDFWWHIKAGEAISSLGKIPEYDIFSFSMAGSSHSWLNISWLWDIFYNYLYQISGLYLPLIVTMLTNAVTMALAIWFMLARGTRTVAVILTFAVCITPYNYMLTPRPHEVTFLMTILFYIIIHQATTSKNHKILFWLPLLMVLWVNCHGGFLVGFTILGAYTLEAFVKRNFYHIKLLTGVSILCLVSTLINPVGIGIFTATDRTLSSAMLPFISEWQPLQFSWNFIPHIIYFFLFFITFNPFDKKISPAEKILSLFWVISSFQHERNIPIGAILSAPILATRLDHLLTKLPANIQNAIISKNNDYEKDLGKASVRLSLFLLSVLASLFLLLGGTKPLMNLTIPDSHPVEEVRYLKENYGSLNVLNDYSQGGYITYGLNNDSLIFVDGRAETAYSPEVIDDYLAMLKCSDNWQKIFEKYTIDAAIIPKESSCVTEYFATSPLWQKVFSGNLDNVYIKKAK